MVSKRGSSPTYKWDIPWGYNPLILTFDPNFRPPSGGNFHQPRATFEVLRESRRISAKSMGPQIRLPTELQG